MKTKTTTKVSFVMKRSKELLAVAALSAVLIAIGTNDSRIETMPAATEFAATSAQFSATVSDSYSGTNNQNGRENTAIAGGEWPSSVQQSDPGVAAQVISADSNSAAVSNRVPTFVPDTKGSDAVAPRDKMSGQVAALLDAGNDGYAELVVRYSERPEMFDDEFVADLGGEVVRTYETLDMRAIRLPVASLESLAADDKVNWLSLDEPVATLSVASREAANVPNANSANLGYTGAGVGIAVLDTGISDHADLSDNIVQFSFLDGKFPIPNFADLEGSGDVREDGFGHGTHVAGLIAGSGEMSVNDYKGSAAGATLVSLQVLDRDGDGSMSDVMAAMDWLILFGDYYNVRVVNMSLGKRISESNKTDPMVAAVERLWDAGFVVVVAAGNEGYEGSMTVTSPGNSRKVITVGSVTDNGTGTDFGDDYMSSFSSQGPTVGDYVLKPDLLAPGNRVVGAVDVNSRLARLLDKRLKECKKAGVDCGDSTYLELSGTSMAAPLVAASAALMLEKDPTLSPVKVKARLMRSARKLEADPTEVGAGILDADAALNDSGVVAGDALSPLMVFDNASAGVLIEDTAALWGDDSWGAAFLFNDAANWASGASYTDASGVTASGYMWTGGGVSAKGYMWTDGGVSAKGYMWTGGVDAKSLLDSGDGVEYFLNDDGPVVD